MISKEVLQDLFGLRTGAAAPAFIIYSEKLSARLNYVCGFIFNHVLNVNYQISNNIGEFRTSGFFKISYSKDPADNAFHILPGELLFEKGVSENKPETKIENNTLYFYPTPGKHFHFDIFSAVFFLISRYEEWQTYSKDEHGRFELGESILFKNNFHLKPLVELWIEELKADLAGHFTALRFPEREFKTISTIDVDNLFAYRGKGFVRTIGAGMKDLLRLDLKNIMRRNAVLNNIDKDPFDIYETFSAFCAERKIPLICFFLLRTGTKYDRTVNPSSEVFQEVFDVLKMNGAFTGLHPSYYSSSNEKVLKNEIKTFAEKTGAAVNISRQHYLRFDIKTTPAVLMKNNIAADFSMGFASGAGFRAGTSIPFYYFDFNSEAATSLLFIPFCAMDGAYFVYNNCSSEEAYAGLKKIKSELEKVKGLYITVFHERTFAGHLYPGFGNMYRKLLEA